MALRPRLSAGLPLRGNSDRPNGTSSRVVAGRRSSMAPFLDSHSNERACLTFQAGGEIYAGSPSSGPPLSSTLPSTEMTAGRSSQ